MSHDFVVGYILHFVIPFLFPTNSFSHDFVVGYILHFAIPFLFPTTSSWATIYRPYGAFNPIHSVRQQLSHALL